MKEKTAELTDTKAAFEVIRTELEKLKDVRSARNKRSALRKEAIAQQKDWGTIHDLIEAVNKSKLVMQELKQLRIEFQDQPLQEEAKREQTLIFLDRSQHKQDELREVLKEALRKLDELDEQRTTMREYLGTRDLLQL